MHTSSYRFYLSLRMLIKISGLLHISVKLISYISPTNWIVYFNRIEGSGLWGELVQKYPDHLPLHLAQLQALDNPKVSRTMVDLPALSFPFDSWITALQQVGVFGGTICVNCRKL